MHFSLVVIMEMLGSSCGLSRWYFILFAAGAQLHLLEPKHFITRLLSFSGIGRTYDHSPRIYMYAL
jgi:hypothetical protein